MQQGLKTVQGKSEMLPLYQEKKERIFATLKCEVFAALKPKFKTKKQSHLEGWLFIIPYHTISIYFSS